MLSANFLRLIVETDPDANYYQMIAYGSGGTITVEAQTSESAPYEPVYTDNTGTVQLTLDTVTPRTKTIENTKIFRFRLTPDGKISSLSYSHQGSEILDLDMAGLHILATNVSGILSPIPYTTFGSALINMTIPGNRIPASDLTGKVISLQYTAQGAEVLKLDVLPNRFLSTDSDGNIVGVTGLAQPLGSVNLNSVITEGDYYPEDSASATTSMNYPIAQIGALSVKKTGPSSIIQTYATQTSLAHYIRSC